VAVTSQANHYPQVGRYMQTKLNAEIAEDAER